MEKQFFYGPVFMRGGGCPGAGRPRVVHTRGSTLASGGRELESARVMAFPSIRTVVFRHEAVVVPASAGAGERLDPAVPGVLAALRFLGLRTALQGTPADRVFWEKSGLAGMADLLAGPVTPRAPDTLLVGRDEVALAEALRAGARAAVLGGDRPAGAHRVASLDAVLELVRREALEGAGGRHGFGRASRNLVAELRGLPEEWSRSDERGVARPGGLTSLLARAADGDAKSTASLQSLAREVFKIEEKGVEALDAVIDGWAAIVPPKLRGKCHAAKLEGDALVVVCTPVVRQELRFAERALVAAVRRLPGCAGVNRLVYSVS